MIRRGAMGAGVVALFGAMAFVGWLTAASADDAPGCEGLSEYRAAMLTAGRAYMQRSGLAELADRDIATWSSDEWGALAEAALAFQRDISAIDPPPWAADWHQHQIAYAGLVEQVAIAARNGGLLMALPFAERVETFEVDNDRARQHATDTCADFARFADEWDGLDGARRDATPVATSTPWPTRPPEPTTTPRPTATPEPTERPWPTVTPTPA